MPQPTTLPTKPSTALAASGTAVTISRARRSVSSPSPVIRVLRVFVAGSQLASRRARMPLSSRACGGAARRRHNENAIYRPLPSW